MLQSIVSFFRGVFAAVGRFFVSLGRAVAAPFLWIGRRGGIIRVVLGAVLIGVVLLYGYFFWTTQRWTGFNTDYATVYDLPAKPGSASAPSASGGIVTSEEPAAATPAQTCRRSMIVDATADLVDFNVNQNAWVSSMILYKLGLFGLDWDKTPFFDNKAAFQRGVNQAVRRTTIELVDTLGRVRGTSQIDQNLQNARGNLQFNESTWYFGLNPFGPKTPTPSFYRSAIKDLRTFNERLEKCQAVFDARGDNLLQFVDRIANDIGSTSAILRERSENYNGGWFDTRADDRFWFAYGQLYGYYGILSATGADFSQVLAERNVGALWADTMRQFQAALRIQPAIISNGREDGWIMPSHLATMGFYILRVRSNLVETRAVLGTR